MVDNSIDEALGGGGVPSAEPAVSSNLLTWTVGDVASNGAGSIVFSLRAPCSLVTNELSSGRLVQVLTEQVATESHAWLTPCQCSPYTSLPPCIP